MQSTTRGLLRKLLGMIPAISAKDSSSAGVVPDSVRIPVADISPEDGMELKQVQASLRESEERFQLITGKAPVMIWMAAADKRSTYFNNQWLEFTGRRLEQELGNGWMEGIHPDHNGIFQAAWEDAFEKRQSFRLEYLLRCASGEFRWVLNTGVPLFKADGEFTGFIGSCIDISDRRATNEILLNLSGRLINAQEEERSRVAQELHDSMSQNMALLSIEIDQLVQIPSQSVAAVDAGLRKVLGRAREISSEMHRMSYELHPSQLDRLGLAAAALSFCRGISSQQGLEVECDFNDVPEALPREIALCLYRVIQESLKNIIKHSGACRATVELRGLPSEIWLRITDEGVGFKPESAATKQGLGLLSMRERLRLVGGTISIESRPSQGTKIEVVVPLKAADPDRQ